MSGMFGVGTLECELFYFTERLPDPPADRVTAVVAWRGRCHRTPVPWYRHGGGPLARLVRTLRGSRAGPDAGPDPGPDRRWPDCGWDVTADVGGPRAVLHSRERRTVRVGGGEYPFPPDGRTLVLLADDRAAPGAGGPTIVVRAVTVPAQPPADAMWTLPDAEQLAYTLATLAGLKRAILAALASDPVARAFLPPEACRPDAVRDVDPATGSSFRVQGGGCAARTARGSRRAAHPHAPAALLVGNPPCAPKARA
jgi:hypothetical protein